MQHDGSAPKRSDPHPQVWRYVFFGFVAIAAYFLITEHRAHVVAYLPYLLLAACPLMHLFHHRGHKHGTDD
jgi:hypothetical protein